MTRLSATLFALLVVWVSTAHAQDAPQGWPGLNTTRLSTVYVRDSTGRETKGKLLRLSPDSLVLLVDGYETRFESGSVRRISKRDSLRNGLIIGTVWGMLVGLVAGGLSDCPGDNPGGACPGERAFFFAVQTGLGAAIGTGVDALIPGQTTIYRAPQAQSSVSQDIRVGSAALSFPRVFVTPVRFRW